jgi:hypothetical protein
MQILGGGEMQWRRGRGKGICLREGGDKIITTNLNGDEDGEDTAEDHGGAKSGSNGEEQAGQSHRGKARRLLGEKLSYLRRRGPPPARCGDVAGDGREGAGGGQTKPPPQEGMALRDVMVGEPSNVFLITGYALDKPQAQHFVAEAQYSTSHMPTNTATHALSQQEQEYITTKAPTSTSIIDCQYLSSRQLSHAGNFHMIMYSCVSAHIYFSSMEEESTIKHTKFQ